jgi:hypothetical protein
MFKSAPNRIALAALKVLLALGVLLLPIATSATPTFALQTNATPHDQTGKPDDDNVVILNEEQNPDGTTTVTVRIYATPNEPNAPDTNFWVSQDTFIASGNPNGNYGADTNLAVGYSSSGGLGALRMLLQFNLSSIPSYATVNSATTYIFQYAATGVPNMGFQAQYAVSPWNEFSATWNNANFIGGAPLPVGNFPSTLGWLSFTSTNLFRSWVNGTEPNYGLIITGNEDPAANSSRWFYSSNAGFNRPYVDINYTTSCAYTTPPTSSVNPLPATSPNAFTVSWTGTAFTPPGCPANGISSYIIWYQVNNGGFIRWLDGVTTTSATFNAASLGIGNGSFVGFRSQATDFYGNKTPAGNATASTTINAVNPTVAMNPLPTWTTSSSFLVSWIGNAQGGPPITTYNFQVSINGGAWQNLLTNTPQTSFQFTGAQTGFNYQFRAQASNNNGASFGPFSAPNSTTADLVAPTVTVNPLPQYTTSTSFWVSWSGTDATSGVAGYNVQYQIDGGAWQALISNTPQTSFYVQNAQTGQKWGFRVQAVDNAGNASAWPANAQTSTTIFANPIALIQPFNPPILQSTAPVTVSFPVSWVGLTPPGTQLTSVTVLVRYNYGTWTLWSTFPATQTSASFNWYGTPGLGDGVYQFQATAANNVGQPPFELPSQYWQTIIVDMAGAYKVRAYLPIITNNATTP